MGLRRICFGLFMFAFEFSEAEWRSSRVGFKGPVQFRHQADFRDFLVPQTYFPSRSLFTPQQFPVETPAWPEQSPQDDVQTKILFQDSSANLLGLYPGLPEEPLQPDVPFDLNPPVSSNGVVVQCGEKSVYVEVLEDFFGTGQPLVPSALMLGGCTPNGGNASHQVLVFEYQLQDCGSTLTMTEDELIYTFSLIYTPQEASPDAPIVRSGDAVVGVACHYPRVHNVSSKAIMPDWIPYASTVVSEELLVFNLKLMADDWSSERSSNRYFLGDFINIEASVMLNNHIPLRVFVDSCVATSVPDTNSYPRYSFIDNNGCLVDAMLTGSNSYFMDRTQPERLRFQLETFRFQQALSEFLYITCILKVAAAFTAINPMQKACSYSANRWVSADEPDYVCGCCDTTCGIRTGSDQPNQGLGWNRVSARPIKIEDWTRKIL